MDNPNNDLERLAISGTAGAMIYGLTWFCGAYLMTGASPLSVIEHIDKPLSAGILPLVVAVPSAIATAIGIFKASYLSPERHIRGYELQTTHHKMASANIGNKSDKGLLIHDKIKITEKMETSHLLILGGSGSGKTTILWGIINQAITRGDKVLIFSYKGDFQEKIQEYDLLAPWDARGKRWQLGRDISTRLDAESLAETLVPTQEKDPIWSQGAQGLLVAVISDLQSKQGVKFGFSDLARACAEHLSNYDKLLETVMRESPLAKAFLMGKDSKTTASFLAEMAARLSAVINIGTGEVCNSKNAAWSVKGWQGGKTSNVAIMGYRPSNKSLSRSWVASIIEQVVRQVSEMPDCDPSERRIWMILDEVPQCGKVPSITEALETLRSKGMRVILGTQSISQIEREYDRHTSTVWAGQTATKIIARLTAPQDQKWASDLLGEREVERYQSQISSPMSSTSGGSPSQSGGYQPVKEHVMMPSDFGRRLNVKENVGPTALIMQGENAAILLWKFPNLTKYHPMIVPAAWTQSGYKRPDWGAVPPQVGGTAAAAFGKQQVEVVAQGVAQQQTIAQDVKLAQLQPADTGEGDAVGEAAEKYAVHELAGVVPGLSIADAVASLYDMSLTGKGIDAKPVQKQTQTEPAVAEVGFVDYEDEDEDEHQV